MYRQFSFSKCAEMCTDINLVTQVQIWVKWSFHVALNTISGQNWRKGQIREEMKLNCHFFPNETLKQHRSHHRSSLGSYSYWAAWSKSTDSSRRKVGQPQLEGAAESWHHREVLQVRDVLPFTEETWFLIRDLGRSRGGSSTMRKHPSTRMRWILYHVLHVLGKPADAFIYLCTSIWIQKAIHRVVVNTSEQYGTGSKCTYWMSSVFL